MKHFLVGLSLVLGALLVTPPTVAQARNAKSGKIKISKSDKTWNHGKLGVPELDPGTAGSAMVLLIGGVAYALQRRRREEDVA